MSEFPIKKISRNEVGFPPAFNELHDPPKLFYYRGDQRLLTRPGVAVVGTRRASEHGLIVARDFSEALARAGFVIVSGLAFGIDAAAHEGSLAAGGATVAVLGSGIDDASIYPRANLSLAIRILARGGVIISENPPGTRPQQWDFPKRNRLIAALAAATVIVEAPEKSGAVITAKYALELGRDVYVVPADALRESALGSNRLLVDGAPPLVSPFDLIKNLGGIPPEIDDVAVRPHNQNEVLILNALKKNRHHVDELIAATGLPASIVMSTVTGLELRGAIFDEGAMNYALRRGQ